jgi:hypothetical protein
MKILKLAASAAALALMAGTTNAAFIVEADNVAPAGKANANFASTPPGTGFSLTATPSTAVGLAGNQSAFGNPANATGPDLYTFSYTPGVDVDNTVFGVLQLLGDTSVTDPDGLGAGAPIYADEIMFASGAVGGGSNFYNVYITWPASANVNAAGSQITITNDGLPIELNPVNQNTDQSEAAPTGAGKNGGNNAWLKIASGVPLTAGNTYTVSMQANAATFVSQRVHGVMWEVIPEPSSLSLMALTAIGLLRRKR